MATMEPRAVLDDTGVALVVAAATLLSHDGPSALTVRRIASTAGVSTMCLYDRFGDKNGVIEQLFLDGFHSLSRAIERAVSGKEPPDCLLAGCQAYRRWAVAHPTQYAVMFTRAVPDFEPSASAKQAAWSTLECLEVGVAAAVDAGVLGGGDAHEVARVIWGVCHGMVVMELEGPKPDAGAARRYTMACRALIDGLRAPSSG
jgi:AcrR family transcriptional regulator